MSSLRQRLQEDIERSQARLAKLDRVPEDRFPFGTILLFSSRAGEKFYIVKKGEEAWANIKGGGITESLDSWIIRTIDNNIGYFEVYEMKTQPQPVYASE